MTEASERHRREQRGLAVANVGEELASEFFAMAHGSGYEADDVALLMSLAYLSGVEDADRVNGTGMSGSQLR